MTKKLFLAAFIFIFVGIKAQIASFEIPTGKLTEESISQILEHAKKKKVQQWEIDKLNTLLHAKMAKQQQQVLNGTYGQKTNLPPPQVNSSSCVNPGFEDGTTNGWTLYNGDINGVSLPCNTCPATAGAITNVVSAASTITGQCTTGSDNYGGFPVVPPSGGGTYALLLNDANAGGKIEKAQYQFVVNSSSDFFTFQYAAVLQSGGHGPTAQPYFSVSVTDLTGGTGLSPGCTDYQASAPSSGNLSGWSISTADPTVYSKPWTTVGIDLSSVIGHTVNISFVVSDCNLGGHFGYCYIDANCSNIFSASNITGICGTAGNNITLTGPPGFASYQWYGPNSPYNIINGATSSTYSIATASAIDTFMVKTVFSAGCLDSFKMVVKPILDINAYTTSTCRGNPNPTGAATVTAGPGNFSYVWNGPSGAMGTFTTTAQSNLTPGTYSVQVVDNTGKCPSKDTTIVVAVVNPILQTSTTQFCGSTPTLMAPNALTGTPYVWYNNSNAITSVTTQTNTLSNAQNGQHYTVTYLDSATHCEDSLKITLNKTTISFAAQIQNPCSGGNNGGLTYNNTTSPNIYPIYNWAVTGATTNNGTVTATSAINLSALSSGSYTMVVSVPGNATCCDTIHSVLSNTATIVPTPITLSPNCNMDTLKIVSSVPNVTHSWSGTSTSGTSVTYPYTAATLTVLPTFTNTIISGYYNYTDSMHSIPGGCLSVTKYIVTLKSFKGSLTSLEKLTCHNDSTGKIKASVTSEVNGPIGTPDKYTFKWSPSTLTTTTAMGAPSSSVKVGLKSNIYICTISNGNCINSYTYNLTNPAPLTNDSIYAYYCPKDSLALVIADTGNFNYVWHPNTAVVSVTGDSAHVLVQDVNKCYVTYLRNGCPDTGKVVISVTTYDAFRPDELVNVFTPNGDKKNDFFYPFYSTNLNQYQIFRQSDSYELTIYDRWGKLVYSATDYSKPWDGKTKSGHDADNGSYFFIVKYKSNCGSKADLVEKKGFVELLR